MIEDRVCLSRSSSCSGVMPCAECDLFFRSTVLVRALLATGLVEEQAERFFAAYWREREELRARIREHEEKERDQGSGIREPGGGVPASTPGTEQETAEQPAPEPPASRPRPRDGTDG